MSDVEWLRKFAVARREIVWAPGYSIDKHGGVFKDRKPVATTSVRSRLGVDLLAVQFSDVVVPVWKVLASMWFDNALILPRDGNGLSIQQPGNIIGPLRVSSPAVITDPDEILLIWNKYCRGAACSDLSEKTGLHCYSEDQYRYLIRDILISGIR